MHYKYCVYKFYVKIKFIHDILYIIIFYVYIKGIFYLHATHTNNPDRRTD